VTVTLWTVLFLLWRDFFHHGVDTMFGRFNLNEPDAFLGNRPHLGFFIFRELAGWSVVAVFAALVRLFLWQSRVSRALTGERRGGLDSHLRDR
jgi:hypothetical protein